MSNFIYPTVQRITSGFRTKDRPNHHGIDFAEKGTHTIKASAAGEVTRSYYSTSYGECVFILHNINGQIYETVYAHMQLNSRKVKVGQKVKQGQAIGIMGNTGDSYGQHLHFELHKGRWNINKTNAVNPLNYLEKTEEKPVNNGTKTYTVKKGDFLGKIAKAHNTSVAAILKMNPDIKDSDIIYIGQKLKIPSVSKAKYYTVRKNDTLSKIAVDNKTSISSLLKLNPSIKNKDVINIGQKIRVK